IQRGSPRDSPDFIAGRTANDARSAFGMIDAYVLLVEPDKIPAQERIPGESLPIRAVLRAGDEELGVLVGHLPTTRPWERADQDLLELYASEVAVAIRNAQLFARVESQNSQLLELDAAKDDFLRGVSHNLQTPLTSIRAYADQLARDQPDRRLGIIAEQRRDRARSRPGPAAPHRLRPRARRRRKRSKPAVPTVRAGRRTIGRRRQRARALRVARALPGHGGRPRLGAARGRSWRRVQHLPAGRTSRGGVTPSAVGESKGRHPPGAGPSLVGCPRRRTVRSDRVLAGSARDRRDGRRTAPDDPARRAGHAGG